MGNILAELIEQKYPNKAEFDEMMASTFNNQNLDGNDVDTFDVQDFVKLKETDHVVKDSQRLKNMVDIMQEKRAEVIYINPDINNYSLGQYDSKSLDILMALIGLCRSNAIIDADKEGHNLIWIRKHEELKLTFNEIRKLAHITDRSDKYMVSLLNAFCLKKNTMTKKIRVNSKTKYEYYRLFKTIEIDEKEKTFTVEWAPESKDLLEDIFHRYITEKTHKIVGIKNKDTKILYLFLLEWKTYDKSITISIDDMKHRWDIKESIELKRRLNKAIKDLQENYNLFTKASFMWIKNKGKTDGIRIKMNSK